MNRGRAVAAVLLALLLLISGIAVVYAKYASRKYFVELETLRAQRDALEVEWGRLQLEQGALATHWRLETLARERIGMRMPAPDDVIVIRP